MASLLLFHIFVALCVPALSEDIQSIVSDVDQDLTSTQLINEAVHPPLWQCTVQPDGTFAVDWEEDKLCPMANSAGDIANLATRLENVGQKMERGAAAADREDGGDRRGEASCTDGDCAHGEVQAPATHPFSDLDKDSVPVSTIITPRKAILKLLDTPAYNKAKYPDPLEGLMHAINDYGRSHGWVWKQQTETPILRTTPMLLDGTKDFGCCFDFSGVMVDLATNCEKDRDGEAMGLCMPDGTTGVHKEKTEGANSKGLLTIPLVHAIDREFVGNVIVQKTASDLERDEDAAKGTYILNGYAQFSNHVYVRNGNVAKVYDPSVGFATDDPNNLISIHLDAASTFFWEREGQPDQHKAYNPALGHSAQGAKFKSWAVVDEETVEPVVREDGASMPIIMEKDVSKSRWQLKRNAYWLWRLQVDQ